MDDHVVIGRQLGLFLRLVERMFADLKEPPGGLDLDRAAYVLLSRIAGDGPARLSTLADDVWLDLSTVSRQVAALEAAGLVARTTDSSDRRAWVIKATDAGNAAFSRNREIWLATLHDLLADWNGDERAEFARLFVRLNDAIVAREGARDAATVRDAITAHPVTAADATVTDATVTDAATTTNGAQAPHTGAAEGGTTTSGAAVPADSAQS